MKKNKRQEQVDDLLDRGVSPTKARISGSTNKQVKHFE